LEGRKHFPEIELKTISSPYPRFWGKKWAERRCSDFFLPFSRGSAREESVGKQ